MTPKFSLPGDFPIQVIPNFVDISSYRPAPVRDGAARLHSVPRVAALATRRRLLVHSSNFRPLKRVDQVVRILAEVRRRYPQHRRCLCRCWWGWSWS